MATLEEIALVAHEANRAWQRVTQDPAPSPAWESAPVWQRESTLEGVRHALDGATPQDLHDRWAARKLADGWTYGPVKDEGERTHPCLLPYDRLPAEQRVHDRLFAAVVSALAHGDVPAPALAPAPSRAPSVGRIVHYVSYGTPGGEHTPQCRAAVVTEVGEHTDKLHRAPPPVGLAVLNPTGAFFNQGVPYGEGEQRAGGTWHWPERTAPGRA
jgi:hypothetical protein